MAIEPPDLKKPRELTWYSRMWNFLEEPRSVTAVQIVLTYWAAIFFGTVSFYNQPDTTSQILGPGLVTFICVLMVTAGVIGTVTAAVGWWWVERILALGFLMVAWLGYVYSVGEAQVMMGGSRWLQLGFLSTSLSGMITRYIRIRKDKYGPGILED